MKSIHILQHALGLNEYGEGRQYRNYFVTGFGTDDYPFCVELVGQGLMTQTKGNAITGGDDVFRVTPAGIDFVALNSPTKPKVSKSKQRYLDYLDSESNFSFGQWLKFGYWRNA